MNEIKVSVIIPVYNVEKYIRKSLESVINQTLKEIEIICVNDGTKDNSRKIIEEYAQKDERIKIIDKENGGLSSARNAGMEVARGEYLGFVDSDDWIEETMYEKLYEKAKADESQMVICGVHKYDDKSKKIVDDDKYYTLEYFPEELFERPFTHEDTRDFLFQVCVMAWNKIYKREFVESLGAKFPHGFIFEDLPFFHSLYLKCPRVSLVKDVLYYYRVNRKDSIVAKSQKNIIDRIDMVINTWSLISQLPYYNDIKEDIDCWFAEDIFYRYTRLNYKYQKEYFYRMQKLFKLFNLEEVSYKKSKNLYYYKDYLNTTNNTYAGFLDRLILNYIEATNRYHNIKFATKGNRFFLHGTLDERKENLEKIYESHRQAQRKWFEKEMENKSSSQRILIENDYEKRLSEQEKWFTTEMENRVDKEKDNIKNYYEERLKSQQDWHEKELPIKLESQKNWYEEEIQKQTTNLKNSYEELMKSELENQKNWYEEEIKNRIIELENNHKIMLEEQYKQLKKEKEELPKPEPKKNNIIKRVRNRIKKIINKS